MTFHVVFDVDGVIVDSASTVRKAYLEAGIIAPVDVLAKEGDFWLQAQTGTSMMSIWELKNQVYLSRIAQADLLPPWATACWLKGRGHVVTALTGAPTGTLEAIKSARVIWPFGSLSRDNIKTPSKMELIKKWGGKGVYVDDQDKYIDLPPDWTFIRYYSGVQASDLFEEIMLCSSASGRYRDA